MADSSEILATFYGDQDFPVHWENEEEKQLFWFFDDNHVIEPISPMFFSLNGWWGPTLDYMYRRFGFPLGKAWIGKRVNGYLYSAVVPRDSKEAGLLGPYYGWIMPTYADKFLDWWNERYLPEIKRNFEYLDSYPTEDAGLQDLMVFLEEAIDIQERHFRIHWILNLAQFQSSMDFQAAAKEVIPDIDPIIIGRILISVKDRNWDSLEGLWQLKEKIKADPELYRIFESGETAGMIIPVLKASERGQAFLREAEAYAKEYGVRAIYPHEYNHKLWVEDLTPVIETVKGYLASDYDFPAAYQRTVDDQRAAMEELASLIPADASPVKREKLENAMKLGVKMMPLTPDHHFYIDQGTFGRLRLVLLAVGRKMVESGLLDDPEEIFFLEYDQLRAYVGNPKSDANPEGYDGRAVITAARDAYEAAWRCRPRDWVGTVTRWAMFEEPYHTLWGWPERFEREQSGVAQAKDILQGLGAAPGIAEGVARVVKGPQEFNQVKRGEILVCITTNPAWVVVFSKIAGVITDTGGVLAHPAVVAREFGIPGVVGTGNATQKIKTGDRLRINGQTGMVEILNG